MIFPQTSSLSVSLWRSGREAEVPLRAGGGHGQTGRTGEEDWEGRGGVQTLLGGPEGGETGETTAPGWWTEKLSYVHIPDRNAQFLIFSKSDSCF